MRMRPAVDGLEPFGRVLSRLDGFNVSERRSYGVLRLLARRGLEASEIGIDTTKPTSRTEQGWWASVV
jgi:hypothetical protein